MTSSLDGGEIPDSLAAVTRRAARRRMSSSQRRQQIVSVAADQFDRHGFTSTSMDQIAREVGVAKPTLYHYFPGKDDILVAIHEEFITLLISRQQDRLGTGLDPAQQLLEIIMDILELMETHHGHVRVFFEHHRELPPDARKSLNSQRRLYEGLVERVLVKGIDSGHFAAANVHLTSLAIFGACNWAYQWHRRESPMRARDIGLHFWSLFMHGLRPDAREVDDR